MASKKPKKPVPHSESTRERRQPAEILASARQMLANAQRGLDDVTSADPARRVPGLHNVAVFGRAVTIALQRLRHIVDGFDEWYSTVVPDEEPLLAYFVQMRNQILKEAVSPVTNTRIVIQSFSGHPAQLLEGSPPNGAVSMFLGESATGGSGWLVRLPDGSEEKYYATLSTWVQVSTHLPDAPSRFQGEDLTDTTVAAVAGRYVSWLEDVVAQAERRFSL